jgi:hypothetical protein
MNVKLNKIMNNVKSKFSVRVEFRNKIHIHFACYEEKINIFGKNSEFLSNLTKSAKLNFNNYLLFNHLQWKNYSKAISHYKTEFAPLDSYKNDITKIICLFMPYLLKSVKMDDPTIIDLNNPIFDHNKLKFINKKNDDLENMNREFFYNYTQLELGNHIENIPKFQFHRREMENYMEIFLNLYTQDEVDQISNFEKTNLMLFHYFRPYIRPEEYYTLNALDNLNKLKVDKSFNLSLPSI